MLSFCPFYCRPFIRKSQKAKSAKDNKLKNENLINFSPPAITSLAIIALYKHTSIQIRNIKLKLGSKGLSVSKGM